MDSANLTDPFVVFRSSNLPNDHFMNGTKVNDWFIFTVFPEKQEKEVDVYASLSDEKAFVFSVALAEINRKILGQRLIL